MIELDGKSLSVEKAKRIVLQLEPVKPAADALERVEASQRLVKKIVREGKRVYGVNTGFGKLSRATIPKEKLHQLQHNLLRSHAAGVGEPLPDDVSRAVLLFKINSLLWGHSGVRKEIIFYLLEFLNQKAYPVIPSKGSVGSSGDLAPLAHLALLLIGEGWAKVSGEIFSGHEILKRLKLEPLKLEPKEGLALINGTQVALALGFIGFLRAKNLLNSAQAVAALAVEALGGSIEPFDERVQSCHPHRGQSEVAKNMRILLYGSKLVNMNTSDVQDPYTLRCIPQVLGASADVLEFVEEKLEIEMNSATDNPLIFPETGEVLCGGNFHGQILAFAMELLGMAAAEMGSFSERRIALLLNAPTLPEFLVKESGLNSGLMLPQYTAASLVAENKVLAHPSAVDSIPTSGGKEDYNSMATISAYKALRIIENVEYILAIELITAAQALDFRDASKMAGATRKAYDICRSRITHLEEDRVLSSDIETARQIIKTCQLADLPTC